MKKLQLTAPSAWAPFLINGDASNLSSHEKNKADDWILELKMGAPFGCEDAGFLHVHNAYGFWPFAADCQTYTFYSE